MKKILILVIGIFLSIPGHALNDMEKRIPITSETITCETVNSDGVVHTESSRPSVVGAVVGGGVGYIGSRMIFGKKAGLVNAIGAAGGAVVGANMGRSSNTSSSGGTDSKCEKKVVVTGYHVIRVIDGRISEHFEPVETTK